MQLTGRSFGFWCGRDMWHGRNHAPYVFRLGFGEGSGNEYDRLYRRNLSIEFRPLRSCFIWRQDFLTIENGEPVYQVRIHQFWRWPISVNWL